MYKFTSGYVNGTSNFIIKFEKEKIKKIKNIDDASIKVIKNIFQRSSTISPSNYLKEKIGDIDNKKIFIISDTENYWDDTIKGDFNNSYYPARVFYNEILKEILGEFEFLRNLILPEAKISDIIEECPMEYVNSEVDFYLPQLKVIIEIDGSQHKAEIDKAKDFDRDKLFNKNGINVIRISTTLINAYKENSSYIVNCMKPLLEKIKNSSLILEYAKFLSEYKNSMRYELEYIAIFRIQIMVLELIEKGMLSIYDDEWKLNLLKKDFIDEEKILFGINDILNFIENIYEIQDLQINRPKLNITSDIFKVNDALNIDCDVINTYDDSLNRDKDIIYNQTMNSEKIEGSSKVLYENLYSENIELKTMNNQIREEIRVSNNEMKEFKENTLSKFTDLERINNMSNNELKIDIKGFIKTANLEINNKVLETNLVCLEKMNELVKTNEKNRDEISELKKMNMISIIVIILLIGVNIFLSIK